MIFTKLKNKISFFLKRLVVLFMSEAKKLEAKLYLGIQSNNNI